MEKLLTCNDKKYRLIRTIIQGVLSVLITYGVDIVGLLSIPAEAKPIIVALLMAIFSPIMADLGDKTETESEVEDIDSNYEEDEEV